MVFQKLVGFQNRKLHQIAEKRSLIKLLSYYLQSAVSLQQMNTAKSSQIFGFPPVEVCHSLIEL